jgi:hypothetical protein
MLSFLALAGCTALPMRPVDTTSIAPVPRATHPSQKVRTRLYLVLDPEAVPDTALIRGERARSELRVTQIRQFVRRDLVRALSNCFDRVDIVAPGTDTSDGLVARVRIDRLAMQGVLNGETFGELTWSLSIATDREQLFEFEDTAIGDRPLAYARDPGRVIESAYRVALERMLRALHGVHPSLIAREAPSSPL